MHTHWQASSNTQKVALVVFCVLIGIGYAVIMTPYFYGEYLEWWVFGTITVLCASIPRKIIIRLLVGMLAGVCGTLAMYLFAYYRGDMGADEGLFFWCMLSWSMFGAQLGIISGVVASAIWAIVRPLNRLVARP